MNNISSYRLSVEEIAFINLVISELHIKEVYGISNPLKKLTKSALEAALESLIKKRFITETAESLAIDGGLVKILKTVCRPKIYFVLRSFIQEGETPRIDVVESFYIRDFFAVSLIADKNAKDYYLLSAFANKAGFIEYLEDAFAFDEWSYGCINERAELDTESFNMYIDFVKNHDKDAQYNILRDAGMSVGSIDDLYEAITSGKNIFQLVSIVFDESLSASMKIVEEILYYGGKNLWQIEISENQVDISGSNKSTVYSKLSFLAEQINYV